MDSELQQLRATWQRQDLRMDGIEALALQAWREPRQQRVRRELRRFGSGQLLWLLAWIGLTAWVAGYWVANRQVPHLLLPGLALHLYGIAAIWVSATRALLAVRVNATGPVVQQALRLAQLQRFTALGELALGLPWWWLWLLATQVGLHAALGIDLYAQAPSWFMATLGSGVVAMGASVWLARHWLRRASPGSRIERLLDSLSGCSLSRARNELRQIERFERE